MFKPFRPRPAPSFRSRAALAAALAPSLLVAAACQGKDTAKCAEALQTVRQALIAGDFDGAAQWREYAYKQCEDSAQLTSLDQEIVERRNQLAAQEQEKKRAEQETAQLIKVLVDWAGAHRGVPDRAAAAPACDPVPDKTPKDEEKKRWCHATRQAGQAFTLEVHYWDADREAVRFSTVAPNPVGCDAFGEHVVLKRWQTPAQGGSLAQRSYCELRSGPVAGMRVIVADAARAPVHIVTPKYLEHDATLRALVQ
jgi:hypothetical protein